MRRCVRGAGAAAYQLAETWRLAQSRAAAGRFRRAARPAPDREWVQDLIASQAPATLSGHTDLLDRIALQDRQLAELTHEVERKNRHIQRARSRCWAASRMGG